MLAVGVGTVGAATPAVACILDNDGDCYRSVTGTVTATAGLRVRSAPWGNILDTVPYQYSNIVDCYVQASDGSYWDWLYDTRIGRSGWVYDAYLYTGGNIYQQVDEMHEGQCGQWPLTMPANVTATAISTASIRVTWSDTNGGSAKYVVSNGNVSSADLPAGTTSYTWSGLAPNTYMCFTVAAKANGGQSPWSPYGCTSSRALTAPTNLQAVATSATNIRISWTDTTGGGASTVVDNFSIGWILPPGTTAYNWGGLAPGTLACFRVAADQSGQRTAWSSSVCATTQKYVNIGDSFSSGEGSYGTYQSGSDTSSNKCHRSDLSYSGRYAAQSTRWNVVTNVACSGAVTKEIDNAVAPAATNAMGTLAAGELAQLSAVDGTTTLVTVTIGGNNLNLAGLIGGCLKDHIRDHNATDSCLRTTFDDAFINSIASRLNSRTVYGDSLADTYGKIKAKAAPNARIVVSTYPQIFPATYTGDCSVGFGLLDVIYLITSQAQLDQIRRVVSTMNQVIKDAAWGQGLSVLDEENAFAGHELCTSSSWVNKVNGWVNASGSYDPESLHPTASGYQRWANDLRAYLGQ
jgi:lysophospholipase L1-like esterase